MSELVQSTQQKKYKLALPNVDIVDLAIQRAESENKARFTYLNDMDVLAYFLENTQQLIQDRGRTERTRDLYRRELTQFIQYMHDFAHEIGLDDITWQQNSLFKSLYPYHLRNYQKWLEKDSPFVKKQREKDKNGYSIATLSRKTTILKQFFKYLYQSEYITQPLHSGFLYIEVKDEDRPNRDMGTKDVVRVMDAFIKTKNIFAFMLVQLLVSTGIRNEELCTLTIGQLKQSIGDSYYLEIMGKGSKRRDVPLRAAVYQSINYYRTLNGFPKIADADATQPLVPTKNGKHFTPSQLTHALKRNLKRVQHLLEFSVANTTPHVFRHAFAIISHENKADIYDIMRSLGHENIKTTRIYLEKIYQQEKHTSHLWHNEINNYL